MIFARLKAPTAINEAVEIKFQTVDNTCGHSPVLQTRPAEWLCDAVCLFVSSWRRPKEKKQEEEKKSENIDDDEGFLAYIQRLEQERKEKDRAAKLTSGKPHAFLRCVLSVFAFKPPQS